jgi:mono/diheme cytochrome c family protein
MAHGLLRVAWVWLALVGCAAADSRRDWLPRYPDTPYPAVSRSKDPGLIREGEYLVKAVSHCAFCHLPKSVTTGAGIEAASRFVPTGGGDFDLGPMGLLVSPNLTSDVATGIGGWTDAELARAIRYGVDRQGRALIYMVGVGPMSDHDLQAIVSYLRTLPPVRNRVPASAVTPEGRHAFLTQMPGFIQPKPQFPVRYVRAGETGVARGAYLANGPAACFSCHSQLQLSPSLAIQGPRFAGSLDAFADHDDPTMELNPPNLTPSRQFGVLSGWTESQFVARIRAGRAVKNSPMPWESFRLMTDSDLISIFRYLQSLPPVERNAGPAYRKAGWKAPSPAAGG